MRQKNRPLARSAVAAFALATALTLTACGGGQGDAGTDSTPSTTEQQTTEVVLATTTSTEDSGLLGEIIPAFEKEYPQYKVRTVAVGSGQALALGEKKDADVLLVHSKASELELMAKGAGKERAEVFYNDFIIVGPPSDPAKIKGSEKATDAFTRIAAAKATFVSRGDDSGTHKKEQSVWASATVDPDGQSWYKSTGQGMGEVLQLASEQQAYTLADRATYLSAKDQLQLDVLVEGDKKLFNQYAVITIPGARNEAGGQAFFDWIQTPEAQKLVGEFGVEKFGRQLFVPNAGT